MTMEWAEFRGRCPDDISRAWAYMIGPITAVGSIFEMRTGQFKAVYSEAGQMVPTVDGPFQSLTDAKKHVELSLGAKILRPRVVLLDHAFT